MTVISADKKLLKEIKETLKNGKELIDFNKIIPMPKELIGTTSPSRIVSEEEYKKAKAKYDAIMAKDEKDKTPEESWCTSLPITKKMSEEYLKKFGSDNWYDWAIHNWGTKWGAYDINNWDGDTISFFTAWSVPEPFYEALSEKFPKAEFEVKFADEGGGWCGIYLWREGIKHELEYQEDYKSPDFKSLYADITGISEEDLA